MESMQKEFGKSVDVSSLNEETLYKALLEVQKQKKQQNIPLDVDDILDQKTQLATLKDRVGEPRLGDYC